MTDSQKLPDVVVLSRIADMPQSRCPATRGKCGKCGEPCWISADGSSTEFIEKGVPALCWHCVELPDDAKVTLVTTPKQIANVLKHMGPVPESN